MALSTFGDLMAGHTELFLNQFGVDITYRPENDSGDDKTIKAVIEPGYPRNEFESPNPDSPHYTRQAFWISSRNNTEGHVSPTEWIRTGTDGDKVQIGGSWFYVISISEDSSDGMHRLEATSRLMGLF